MSGKIFSIGDRPIGPEYSPYLVAELSANHNGDLDRALSAIKAAKDAGADAIKFQTYTADTMTIDCEGKDFHIEGGLWDGYSLYQLYQWAQTPFEWHKALFEKARELDITAFSTPFDETAVCLLEDLNVPAYKIASFEVTDLPLIHTVAETGKPMIISTGMANEKEIEEAVITAREGGCKQLMLLHCVSSYPAPVSQCNLLTIPELARRFDVNVGLSDHTLGLHVAIASVPLGSCFIEKHFVECRSEGGPDVAFSLEPPEFRLLAQEARECWQALGVAGYERKAAEEANIKFRRSLYVVKDIHNGEQFSKDNVRRIRPGYGLEPRYIERILGCKANRDIKRGTAVSWDLVELS